MLTQGFGGHLSFMCRPEVLSVGLCDRIILDVEHQEQLEQTSIHANVAKFQKGNIYLPCQNGLKDELAVTYNTHNGWQILMGTFKCRHVDKNEETFITELEKPTHIQPISTRMSTTKWCTPWMKHWSKRRKSFPPLADTISITLPPYNPVYCQTAKPLSLTYQQCKKIDKAPQQAFIQKVGVSSKFPIVL